MRRFAVDGFSLIELMVALVVLAILAAVGYPLYTEQVQKSRRYDAQGLLMILANELEKDRSLHPVTGYYSATAPFDLGDYAEYWDGNATSAPFTAYGYTYSLTAISAPATFTFTVTATPTAGGPQVGDQCGTMTLDESGLKGAADTQCWK